MLVYLKLYGGLQKPEGDDEPQHLNVPQTATVGELLAYAKIDPGMAKILLVNGVHAEQGQELKDGDAVSVFPPVAGG